MPEENTPQENNTPASEVSLDQLAASLTPVAPVAPEASAQAPASTAQQTETVQTAAELPDPALDPEGFNKALAAQHGALAGQLGQITDFIHQQNAAAEHAKTSDDMNAAVKAVAEQVEKMPERVIRGLLKDEYDTNPAFKQVWDNRDKNPAVFNQALGLIAKQYRDDFAVTVDPQIAENQRAFEQSINSASTGSLPDQNQRNYAGLDKVEDAEFDRAFAQLASTRQ